MPASRLYLFLAWLGQLALANDSFCMVQRLAMLNEASLDALEIPENVSDDLLLAIEELPMKFILNASKEEMLKLNRDLLETLIDPSYMAKMYEGIKNFSTGLAGFSSKLVAKSQQLVQAAKSAKTGQAYFLLEKYALVADDAMADLAGSVVDVMRELLEALPEGALRNKTEVPKKAMRRLTKTQIADYITSTVLRPKTKKIFDDRGAFCRRFSATMFKSMDLDASLSSLIMKGFQEAKRRMPELGPSFVRKSVPEIEPQVMHLLNVSLDATFRSFRGVSLGYHMMNKALTEVASTRLNCILPANVTVEDLEKAEAEAEANKQQPPTAAPLEAKAPQAAPTVLPAAAVPTVAPASAAQQEAAPKAVERAAAEPSRSGASPVRLASGLALLGAAMMAVP